ncbi:TPA: hypothetical protein ACGWER_001768 [Streptococcus agalactiae]|nr:hypothetical protein [Streptococcus agalactiae]HEO2267416.1 hypothetical protein [Streptococcus agalactiae]HEO7770418.1 hypothetical protein [Streptococcus agalactiae]
MSNKFKVSASLEEKTKNKLGFLQGYDINVGKKTVSQVIEELINAEYDRVTKNIKNEK